MKRSEILKEARKYQALFFLRQRRLHMAAVVPRDGAIYVPFWRDNELVYEKAEPIILSVAKWLYIYEHPDIEHDAGRATCALCMYQAMMFEGDCEYATTEEFCEGCPVSAKVGIFGCVGTPFSIWINNPNKRTAKAEMEFLIKIAMEIL